MSDLPLNTIIHGDCLEVMQGWPDNCVDLVITSPPYNLKRKWWNCGANGVLARVAEKHAHAWYDDNMPEAKYQEWQKATLRECLRVAPCVAYNHRLRYAIKRCGRVFHPMEFLGEFPLWVEIVWDRGGGITFNSRRPIVADERIYVFGRPAAWTHTGLTTVWRIPPERGQHAHPCPFPEEIPARLIRSFMPPAGVVLDPFCGSGTTCVAAKAQGFDYIGIDILPDYCAIARRRLAATEKNLFAESR